MSEYQRYEFMTVDRPLTRAEQAKVDALSSHIKVTATHALIEYHWGDFKHDPIAVLRDFFDGFLYWANWGSPHFALRFPHGVLPADLIDNYDCDDLVTFTKSPKWDILEMQFGEMESPDQWVEYDLGSLIGIREELMNGDLRALYIAWLASQRFIWDNDEEEDAEDGDYWDEEEEEEENEEGDDELRGVPAVPPNFGKLTAAQRALAELLQISQELLLAVARHSGSAPSARKDDFAAWVELLPQDRRSEYLVRLARNEPGLSHLLVRELRKLRLGQTGAPLVEGERVTYATLLAESNALQEAIEREKREREEQERLRHLQDIHDHVEVHWRHINKLVERSSSSGYDEATSLLVELRAAAEQFNELQIFNARFHDWIQGYLRRPALLQRLRMRGFAVPGA